MWFSRSILEARDEFGDEETALSLLRWEIPVTMRPSFDGSNAYREPVPLQIRSIRHDQGIAYNISSLFIFRGIWRIWNVGQI